MKKQRGGEGEAVGVFVLLLILGIVGGLVWYFTRDDSSPSPSPTPTPLPTPTPIETPGPNLNQTSTPYVQAPPSGDPCTEDIISMQGCNDLQFDNDFIISGGQVCPQQCIDSLYKIYDVVDNSEDTCYQSVISSIAGGADTDSLGVNITDSVGENITTCNDSIFCRSVIDTMRTVECSNLIDNDNRISISDGQVCPQQCLGQMNRLSDMVNDPSNFCYPTVMDVFGDDASTIISDNIETCQNHLSSD